MDNSTKEKFTYVISSEDVTQGLSVMKLFRGRFPFSARMRTRIKKNHGVLLNGRPIEGFTLPKAGDVISVIIPDENSYFEPQDIPITPVYEDDDLLVLDKQAGIVVHPTHGHPRGTVANAVTKYMADQGEVFKIRFINRLDMDTSGLLVLGKNAHAQDAFIKEMKAGHVEKKYLAMVEGIFPQDSGTIDAPLGQPDPSLPARGVVPGGREAVTHYRVLRRFTKGYTLMELILETGRTHQIRVHLSHMGFPIAGDLLYGGSTDKIKRQALHASSLSFPHPVTGAPMTLEAPLPSDFISLMDSL